ncbi:MAG: phosphoribosylformylglycinamidine synthase, partial [Betaproteobacteria bacterium]|nr:phosphoribosylformylglycinamidine synthase [Betaproteobacteria bacterium]
LVGSEMCIRDRRWEDGIAHSERLSDPLSIMLEGPLGAASFNNEFGRPNLLGYFRSFEHDVLGERRGYRKPVMIAGGVGQIDEEQVQKKERQSGHLLIQLGGPGFRIGMGGGAASSLSSGSNSTALDFDSVQRANPEMQRRAQQVIESCVALGKANPIVAIHDVGAGGLSNAFPELVHGKGQGADIVLASIPVDEQGMSPAEIWCNESQERYALAIAPEMLGGFAALCERERCPFAVIGEVNDSGLLRLLAHRDDPSTDQPVQMPLDMILGSTPRLSRDARRRLRPSLRLDSTQIELASACQEVLRHPSVASKSYLITIGDRSVGGLSHRDPMVGPWQVPVADCGVGLRDFAGFQGDALAVGERAPIAVWQPAAASRMAMGEAITNLLGTGLSDIKSVKFSANWMAACGRADEDADLYDAVQALSELAQKLGVAIPVGKDSLSMRATLQQQGEAIDVLSPVTLVASAWAPVDDIRHCKTPQLQQSAEELDAGVLLLIDLADGKKRMGGSILTQCFSQHDSITPDLDAPELLMALAPTLSALIREGLVQAVHDRSDGGLWACVCEMCFAGRCGASINLDLLTMDAQAADWGDFKIRPDQVSVQRHEKTLEALFNEELGVVIQVSPKDRDQVFARLRAQGLSKCTHVVGRVNPQDRISIYRDAKLLYEEDRSVLQAIWTEPSYRMASLRDDADCAREEYERLNRPLSMLRSAPSESLSARRSIAAPAMVGLKPPRVAILREQGVNSHKEMAAVFTRAGFEAVDVTMTDLIAGRFSLNDGTEGFRGLAACGGFSYGDVLGAGSAWAKSILLHTQLKDQFAQFFAREDSFSLGVCNGCQMMVQLKSIIPGAEHWPRFLKNRSGQFEGRLSLVRVEAIDSPWLEGFAGSLLPIVVSHGEGRASFDDPASIDRAIVGMRYALADGSIASLYPENPNGSPEGIASLCASEGRVLIVMPHPERSFLARQLSWTDPAWTDTTPWFAMFDNMRRFAAG